MHIHLLHAKISQFLDSVEANIIVIKTNRDTSAQSCEFFRDFVSQVIAVDRDVRHNLIVSTMLHDLEQIWATVNSPDSESYLHQRVREFLKQFFECIKTHVFADRTI